MKFIRRERAVADSRRRPGSVALLSATLLALLLVVVPAPKPASAHASPIGTYFPLPPARILDTRFGIGAAAQAVGPNQTINVTVLGQGGIPAAGVSAVVLNITATGASAASWMTVWPAGESIPTASSLNYVAGQTVPNLVKVKVGIGGQVSINNAAGSVHVLADVAGWYKTGSDPVEGARYHAVSPSRILDTRFGNGAPMGQVTAGSTTNLQVAGRGGVPPNGVSAVALNVTAVLPTAPSSFLIAWPTGGQRPDTSNLNYVAGDVVPNMVIVKTGDLGQVSLYNQAGSVHLLADVVGWYSAAGGIGSAYTPLTPSRVLDTRFGNGAPAAPVNPGSTTTLQVTGRGNVPAAGVSAVVMNVTAVGPTADSFLTAWPAGENKPDASNLNYRAGQIVPNLVVVKVSPGGAVNLYNEAGQVHLLADVVGWFGPMIVPDPVIVDRYIRSNLEHPHRYVPETVAAPPGATVNMTFENIGDETHTFTSPPIGIDRAVDGGFTIQFSFTMPFQQTQFVCLVHQSEGMVGTLIPTS